MKQGWLVLLASALLAASAAVAADETDLTPGSYFDGGGFPIGSVRNTNPRAVSVEQDAAHRRFIVSARTVGVAEVTIFDARTKSHFMRFHVVVRTPEEDMRVEHRRWLIETATDFDSAAGIDPSIGDLGLAPMYPWEIGPAPSLAEDLPDIETDPVRCETWPEIRDAWRFNRGDTGLSSRIGAADKACRALAGEIASQARDALSKGHEARATFLTRTAAFVVDTLEADEAWLDDARKRPRESRQAPIVREIVVREGDSVTLPISAHATKVLCDQPETVRAKLVQSGRDLRLTGLAGGAADLAVVTGEDRQEIFFDVRVVSERLGNERESLGADTERLLERIEEEQWPGYGNIGCDESFVPACGGVPDRDPFGVEK